MMELKVGGQDRRIVWMVKKDIIEEKYKINIIIATGETMERNEVDMMTRGHMVCFVLLGFCNVCFFLLNRDEESGSFAN